MLRRVDVVALQAAAVVLVGDEPAGVLKLAVAVGEIGQNVALGIGLGILAAREVAVLGGVRVALDTGLPRDVEDLGEGNGLGRGLDVVTLHLALVGAVEAHRGDDHTGRDLLTVLVVPVVRGAVGRLDPLVLVGRGLGGGGDVLDGNRGRLGNDLLGGIGGLGLLGLLCRGVLDLLDGLCAVDGSRLLGGHGVGLGIGLGVGLGIDLGVALGVNGVVLGIVRTGLGVGIDGVAGLIGFRRSPLGLGVTGGVLGLGSGIVGLGDLVGGNGGVRSGLVGHDGLLLGHSGLIVSGGLNDLDLLLGRIFNNLNGGRVAHDDRGVLSDSRDGSRAQRGAEAHAGEKTGNDTGVLALEKHCVVLPSLFATHAFFV